MRLAPTPKLGYTEVDKDDDRFGEVDDDEPRDIVLAVGMVIAEAATLYILAGGCSLMHEFVKECDFPTWDARELDGGGSKVVDRREWARRFNPCA